MYVGRRWLKKLRSNDVIFAVSALIRIFPVFFVVFFVFFSNASIAEIFNLKLWDESSVDGASGLRINVLFSLKILL